MTFDERVRALAPLGYTERQTKFLVTVALHGGYCLRRHYALFASREYGQAVRDFMEELVWRGLARRLTFRADRGHVYHLQATSLYRAIGEKDNRNRRPAPPGQIARRLMLLDYVLLQRGVWLATEREKVRVFTAGFGVPETALPRRVYRPAPGSPAPATRRYFIHKLPIGLRASEPAVSFVCLVTDRRGRVFTEFVADHAALLNHLPSWRLVALAPRDVNGLPACKTIWETLMASSRRQRKVDAPTRLRHCMRMRQAADDNTMAGVSMDDIAEFRETVRWLGGRSRIDALYERWCQGGDAVLENAGDVPFLTARDLMPDGFSTHRLQHRYDRFDTVPEAG